MSKNLLYLLRVGNNGEYFKLGDNSLSLTLPIVWVRRHGVEKGQEINIYQEGERLVISLDPIEIPGEKEKSIDELMAIINPSPAKANHIKAGLYLMLNKGKKKKPASREGRL